MLTAIIDLWAGRIPGAKLALKSPLYTSQPAQGAFLL